MLLWLWLKCCFTSTETVGLLGTGAQDVHLDFHTAPELCGVQLTFLLISLGLLQAFALDAACVTNMNFVIFKGQNVEQKKKRRMKAGECVCVCVRERERERQRHRERAGLA